MARVASKPCETSGPHPARHEVAELALDECRQAVTTGAVGSGAEKGGEMLAHDLVEHGVLGVARAVRARRSPRRAGTGGTARVHRSCAAVFAGSGRGWRGATALRVPHGAVINERRGARETTSSA